MSRNTLECYVPAEKAFCDFSAMGIGHPPAGALQARVPVRTHRVGSESGQGHRPENGTEAFRMVQDHTPDRILMDIRLPGENG
jgi:hypothetical protein